MGVFDVDNVCDESTTMCAMNRRRCVRRFCSERVGQFGVEAEGHLVNELMHEGVVYLVNEVLNEVLNELLH